ncbi:MAG: hypothetical protein C0602_05995 [Denitrovibrio sp.]|nr:MAG: hypothetical protein C0602_05995 [Denitrovibrio sp.]
MKKKVIAVFTDIHGCQYEHVKLIEKIKENNEIVQYIYLGDLIDRGQWSKWVLRYVKNLMESDTPVILLKGNHEDKLLRWLSIRDNEAYRYWMRNGGEKTVESFTKEEFISEELRNEMKEYLSIFDNAKIYHVQKIGDKTYIFSHSGGDRDTLDRILDGEKMGGYDLEDLMYSRERYFYGGLKERKNTYYVFGHTSLDYKSAGLEIAPVITKTADGTSADIGLDTGCCYGNALSVLLIDSETGEYETVSFPYTEPPCDKEPSSD